MDGIKLNRPPDDRLQRMVDDPVAYFAECEERAREMIERDLERDRQRRRDERRAGRKRWWKR